MNEIIENLEKFKSADEKDQIFDKIDEFMNYMYDNDLTNYVEDIKSNEDIKYLILNEANGYNWQTIKNMFEDIENCNHDYYMMNGYGWLKNVNNSDINSIIDNVVYDLKNEKVIDI
jgi:hypothetical protein